MAGGTLGLPAGLPSNDVLELVPTGEAGEPGYTNNPEIAGGGAQENAGIARTKPRLVVPENFVRYVNREMSRAEPHVMAQRDQMREADRFMHSHQLSEADRLALTAAKRPDTVINEIQKFIKFASGIERRTQEALIFGARTLEDEKAQIWGELCTKTYEWFCDHSAAQYERSMAFERKLITGMAFVDIGLTRVTDPGGAPRYNLCDEFDFWWPQTSKQNLGMGTATPVRWLARESDMDVDEALRKWPDYSAFLLASSGGPPLSDQFPDFGYGAKRAIPYVVPWVMTAPLNKDGGGGDGSKPGKVKILEWQHYDDEPGYYFFDPIYHDDTWLSERDFAKYRRYLRTLQHTDIRDYDKQDHRVYKRSFLLNRKILLQEPRPLPTRDAGYTWNVMTGAWDRSDKVFYGMIRLFMPTQRYINAFFRQTLEIMGAANKGGYLMETGAVTTAQKRDIEENGARPGSINIVQAGAITAGKIKDKPVPQLPQGTMQVLAFCIDLTEKISGLSMSLIGNAPASTPGVSLRRQMTSAMLLLAAEFDALSRFRKREGELVFEYMRLLADDRIVRIGGAFDGQMVQLTKDPFAIKYDIVLDEIEQDPNLRQYYTDQIMKIAPILVRTGNFFPQLLDYVNIPAQFRQQLKQGIQQSEQQKMQMAMQGIQPGGRGKPRGIQEIQADVAVKHGRALKDVAQAQHLAAQATAVTTNSRVGTLDKAMNVLLEGRRLNQEDKKISLQALAQMFDALRPEPAPAARHS